jgi:hypothetical protein
MRTLLNRVLMGAAITAALAGCATYRLGSMLPPNINTVYVPTAGNETSEPFIEVDVTRAIMQAIQTDGSLKIASVPEEADAVLSVVLREYSLEPLTYERERRTAANEYRLLLRAKVLLTHSKTGKILVENPLVQGESTFEIAGDFTTSKASGLPAAAKDLGRHVVDAIVEAW